MVQFNFARGVLGGLQKKALFRLVDIFVVVDAIGLETDFTLETNRKE